MKYLPLLFLLLIVHSLQAQLNTTLVFPGVRVPMQEASLQTVLFSQFPELNQEGIVLHAVDQYKTRHSFHYSFAVFYHEQKIAGACLKINANRDGVILSIKKELPDLSALHNYDAPSENEKWTAVNLKQLLFNYWKTDRPIQRQEFQIAIHENQASLVTVIDTWDKQHDETLILQSDGTVLHHFDNRRHFNIDTTVTVQVFQPDPLTALNLTYGGLYADHNDSNLAWMNAAYLTTQLKATFDNGTNTFYLENAYAKIDDIESPSIAPVTSTTPSFLFNRSESGFEDVNALYHITRFHDYISSIGYDTMMNLQLTVDTHAQFGADNSVFNRNGGSPTLCLGTGGVDDAEDADVIIHEYCHGVSWSANHNNNFSNDRSALDEGLADYFATSYSRAISSFHWDSVFTWDGHNEYWPGRTASTANNYPYSGNIWSIGEIWNAAMSKIWGDLGQVVSDKLMLESLPFFTDNTTLPEAAMYVLESDTLLFGGIHTNTICADFKSKNLLDADCKAVGVSDIAKLGNMELKNTLGFASGQEEAILTLPQSQSGNYQLYSSTGQLVKTIVFNDKNSVLISPSELAPGLYLLSVNTSTETSIFKLNLCGH